VEYNYNLALIGFGNVNRTLAEIIQRDGNVLAQELGFTLRVTAITDLRFGSVVNPDGVDLDRALALGAGETFAVLDGGQETCNNQEIITSDAADIIVEATFTNPEDGQPALSHVRWGLESGKSVCTTNKGPAAFAARELSDLAAKNGVRFECEGAVMSGTPVLRLATGPMKGVGVRGFSGILNGTSNHVFTRMESGLSQGDAITEAQELGYAEADPTADIGGSDVRLKVTLLANELWGTELTTEDVPTQGITSITHEKIEEASAQGAHWKLIGQAQRDAAGNITASVGPQMLPSDHPLAGISGATNAVMFDTKYLGPVTISGPGAGREETAYALLSDIVAIDGFYRSQ
jgi:homoserine dehydrogenase